MLVLSRKVGESILISESIRVTVVQSTNHGRIRWGLRPSGGQSAPRGTDQVLLQLNAKQERQSGTDPFLLQLNAKQERQSGSIAYFRLAAPSIQVQPDLPVQKPPGPLPGTGNGVIQLTIAPSSQGVEGPSGTMARIPSKSSHISANMLIINDCHLLA